jgi:hypothetical protein
MVDSHEHLCSALEYGENGPDVLQGIFHHYVHSDLWSAGCSKEAFKRFTEEKDVDIAERFEGVRESWERVQFTSYGHASRLIAREIYGIEEITGENLARAQRDVTKPNVRTRFQMLRDRANIDHVQIDSFTSQIEPDPENAEFFLYDLAIFPFASGDLELKLYSDHYSREVGDAKGLREVMEMIFTERGPIAVAAKTQHAYSRALDWEERTDQEVDGLIGKLASGKVLDLTEKAVLGDWGLARSAELAECHNLPIKIHTGYLAGNDCLDLERIRPARLWKLFARFPNVRFVLMHTGYPFGGEIAALAKQFRNVYADLCWAWSIDRHSTVEFVRRMIHTCPSHKLFGFGGDTFYPEATVAFAMQARDGLNEALQAEVDSGDLTEKQAMGLATRFMQANQYACFNIEAKKAQ